MQEAAVTHGCPDLTTCPQTLHCLPTCTQTEQTFCSFVPPEGGPNEWPFPLFFWCCVLVTVVSPAKIRPSFKHHAQTMSRLQPYFAGFVQLQSQHQILHQLQLVNVVLSQVVDRATSGALVNILQTVHHQTLASQQHKRMHCHQRSRQEQLRLPREIMWSLAKHEKRSLMPAAISTQIPQ